MEMCQRDNNPTKEQITTELHQWVLMQLEIPAPEDVLQLATKQKNILSLFVFFTHCI